MTPAAEPARDAGLPAEGGRGLVTAAVQTGPDDVGLAGRGPSRSASSRYVDVVDGWISEADAGEPSALLEGLLRLVDVWPTSSFPPARIAAALSKRLSAVERDFLRGILAPERGETILADVVDVTDGYWSEQGLMPPACAGTLRRTSRYVATAAADGDVRPALDLARTLTSYWNTCQEASAVDDSSGLALRHISAFWSDVDLMAATSGRPSGRTARELHQLISELDALFRERGEATRREAEALRTSLAGLLDQWATIS